MTDRRRNGHGRGRHGHGHGREERMSKSLRDAFMLADEGAELPILGRLISLGVPEGDVNALISATFDSKVLQKALAMTANLVASTAQDDPEDSPEDRMEAAAMHSLLMLIGEESEQEAFRNAMFLAAHCGLLEGIVLGWVIGIRQDQARRNAMRQRPRR